MNYTLNDIDEKVWRTMVIESDSTTYDRTKVRIPKINAVAQNVCKGRYKDITSNINNPVIYEGGDMIFLRKVAPYTTFPSLPTTAPVAIGATTIPLSNTTNYPATGAIIIRNNIIPYTGKTSTSFTGVTNVLAPIESGSVVDPLFTLPANYHKSFLMKYTGNSVDSQIDFKDFRNPQQGFTNYYIVGDSDVGQYLYINGDAGNYRFYYYKTVPDMVIDTDQCVIPDSYPLDMIALIVAGELLYEFGLEDEALRKLSIGYGKLNMFYSEYAETTKTPRETVIFKQAQTAFVNVQSG